MTVEVLLENGYLYVRTPYNELDLIKARGLPQRRWIKTRKAWQCRPSLSNFDYIAQAWPNAKIEKAALEARNDAQKRLDQRAKVMSAKQGGEPNLSSLDDVPFRKPPMKHQKVALLLGRDLPSFAYLMDQGTGKTKVAIDDAAHNWRKGRIEAMIVIAPNSVKTNWVSYKCHRELETDIDAIEAHMAPDVPVHKAAWFSNPTGPEKAEWAKFEHGLAAAYRQRLIVLAVNVEALIVPRLFEFLEKFVTAFKTMIVVDESTRIKTPGSKRSRAAKELRKPCPVARIMSGTPIVKRPLDAYSQFEFLDEDILGFGSFYAFRNTYAIMKEWEGGKFVVAYKNLEELGSKIASCSYRVTKKECLDLPPQDFKRRNVYMTKEQQKAYDDMRKLALVILEREGKKTRVEAKIVLTQMLRLQQITSGYLPVIDEKGEQTDIMRIMKPEHNPKLEEVMSLLDEAGDQKALIWCRFRPEIEDLAYLMKKAKLKFYEFHGGVPEGERIKIRKAFFNDPDPCYMLGNTQAGGIGIDEFKAASLVIYVSNSADTEQRVQSQDRAHRIGSEMHECITYYDLIVPSTVDVRIKRIIDGDLNLSAQIMKDGYKAWL